MCTGLTLTQLLPRRPAAYGEPTALTTTPSWPADRASAMTCSCDNGISRHLAGYAVGRGDLLEHLQAGRERLVDEVTSVDVQHVEEPRGQHGLALGLGAEAAHRLLEGARRAGLVERERLAVEDDVGDRQRPGDVDDLGHAGGDVGEAPGVDADDVAATVDLDPRAVELVLDRRLAGRPQGRRDVGRGRGEHRLHGRPHASQTSAREAGSARAARRCREGPVSMTARRTTRRGASRPGPARR